MIDKKRFFKKSHLLSALLCLLVAKLAFTGFFVCSSPTAVSLPFFEQGAALAEDDKEALEDGGESAQRADGGAPPGDVPKLSEIQGQIAALESQLKGVNASIDRYSKSLPRTSDLSPETLEQKRLQLEQEKSELDAERERLDALRQEIDQKVSELTEIQAVVRRELEEKKTVRDNRIKHLIKVYTTMPPKKAAVLIEKLEMEVIIALFSNMKGENVGQILPFVAPEKAALISERLARLDL